MLVPGGWFAVFDGDYATATVAKDEFDPLQPCIERGADVLVQRGCIGAKTAEALKVEAKRRSDEAQWFGHIAFASVIARKPAA